jgi:hypothetical protein
MSKLKVSSKKEAKNKAKVLHREAINPIAVLASLPIVGIQRSFSRNKRHRYTHLPQNDAHRR